MKVRPTSFTDAGMLHDWIERDPEHKGKVDADFFSLRRQGADHFTVTDDEGKPLLFVTLEKVVRGHVQFGARQGAGKNAEALRYLAGFLKTRLPKIGIREFITESTYDPLIAFLRVALGMRKLEADYSATLGEPAAARSEI